MNNSIYISSNLDLKSRNIYRVSTEKNNRFIHESSFTATNIKNIYKDLKSELGVYNISKKDGKFSNYYQCPKKIIENKIVDLHRYHNKKST